MTSTHEITRVQSGEDALLDIYCGDQLFQLCVQDSVFMFHDGRTYPIHLRAFQHHRCVFGRFELTGGVHFKIVMWILSKLNRTPYHRFVRLAPVTFLEGESPPPFLAIVTIDELPRCTVVTRDGARVGECLEHRPEVFPFWSNYQVRIGDQLFHILPVSPREEIPEARDALWAQTRSMRNDFSRLPAHRFSRLRLW